MTVSFFPHCLSTALSPGWVCREEKSSNESLKIQGTSPGLTVASLLSLHRSRSPPNPSYVDASRFGSAYLSKLGFDHNDKNATLGTSGVGLTQHLKVRCIPLSEFSLPPLRYPGAPETRHARHRSAAHEGSQRDCMEAKSRL